MNGLESITESILEDARRDADNILDDARKQAEKILKDATRDSQASALTRVGNEQLKARAQKDRAVSSAQLEERKAVLAAKHEMIELVFEKLSASLQTLDRPTYVRLLQKIAEQSKTGGELVFSERDKSLSEDVLSGLDSRFTVSSQTANNIHSGFILQNGNVTADCSVEAFVRELRREYEPIIADQLFANQKN